MDELREDDVLIHCALRFDGWKYKEATGFDHFQALDCYWETGEWALQPEEQLCMFFLLQRGLYKYGS